MLHQVGVSLDLYYDARKHKIKFEILLMMGACARNMYSDSAEIKPAQCCIKLVFHLTYTVMHGNTKLKISF